LIKPRNRQASHESLYIVRCSGKVVDAVPCISETYCTEYQYSIRKCLKLIKKRTRERKRIKRLGNLRHAKMVGKSMQSL
jgi:hypothetical protein